LGGSATVSIGSSGKIGLLLFDAVAGQSVSLSLSGSTFSTCSLYILGPTQVQLQSVGCTSSWTFIDSTSLPSTGTYTIGIDPGTSTGSLNVTLNNASDLRGTIAPGGASVIVTTTAPGQDARLTFTGTVGQRVSLAVTNVTTQTAVVYLVKPDGTNQISVGANPSCNPCFIDTQTLALTGTYTLWVQHYLTYKGSETLQLYNVVDTTGTVTVGGAAGVVTISTRGQNGQVTFTGTNGQQVTVHITNNSIAGTTTVKLLNPSGGTLTSTGGTGSFNLATQTLSTTGTYTITVDPFAANTGSLSVNVTNP
jgi:hypothetical protein